MCYFQTPFVRQNTPHPRDLKAKAHKLFSRGQNSLEESDLQVDFAVEAVNRAVVPEPERPPEPVPVVEMEPETVIGNGTDESSEPSADDDDSEQVSSQYVKNL